jgi:hypothetical protein
MISGTVADEDGTAGGLAAACEPSAARPAIQQATRTRWNTEEFKNDSRALMRWAELRGEYPSASGCNPVRLTGFAVP